MCTYVRDVLLGELPDPCTDQNARRFAQAALIPGELLDREHINTRHAAATLGIPEHELADAIADPKASREHVAHGRLTSSPPPRRPAPTGPSLGAWGARRLGAMRPEQLEALLALQEQHA